VDGLFVQLDGDEPVTITIRPRHLVAAEPATVESEHDEAHDDEDSDNDEDEDEVLTKVPAKVSTDATGS